MPRSVEAVHRDQEVYYSQDCRDVILRKPKTFEMKLSRSYLISSDFNQQEFVLHKHSSISSQHVRCVFWRAGLPRWGRDLFRTVLLKTLSSIERGVGGEVAMLLLWLNDHAHFFCQFPFIGFIVPVCFITAFPHPLLFISLRRHLTRETLVWGWGEGACYALQRYMFCWSLHLLIQATIITLLLAWKPYTYLKVCVSGYVPPSIL